VRVASMGGNGSGQLQRGSGGERNCSCPAPQASHQQPNHRHPYPRFAGHASQYIKFWHPAHFPNRLSRDAQEVWYAQNQTGKLSQKGQFNPLSL